MSDRCGAACYTGSDLDKHAPIKFSAEVIWVAKGSTLAPPADWRSGCPETWSSQCQSGPTTPTTTTPTTVPATTPTTPTTPPTTTAPTGSLTPQPTVVSGNRSLTVSWPAVQRAKAYRVRYSLPRGGNRWLDETTARTVTISGRKNGVAVTVQVRALVRGKWTDWGVAVGTPGS